MPSGAASARLAVTASLESPTSGTSSAMKSTRRAAAVRRGDGDRRALRQQILELGSDAFDVLGVDQDLDGGAGLGHRRLRHDRSVLRGERRLGAPTPSLQVSGSKTASGEMAQGLVASRWTLMVVTWAPGPKASAGSWAAVSEGAVTPPRRAAQ